MSLALLCARALKSSNGAEFFLSAVASTQAAKVDELKDSGESRSDDPFGYR